jgi:hypothetical protein
MSRDRDGVEVYAGRDDFKGFDELKETLSRARPKDSTLDYALRRGMEAVRAQKAEQGRPTQRTRQESKQPEREAKTQGHEKAEASRVIRSGASSRRKKNSSRSPVSPTSIPRPRRGPPSCATR